MLSVGWLDLPTSLSQVGSQNASCILWSYPYHFTHHWQLITSCTCWPEWLHHPVFWVFVNSKPAGLIKNMTLHGTLGGYAALADCCSQFYMTDSTSLHQQCALCCMYRIVHHFWCTGLWFCPFCLAIDLLQLEARSRKSLKMQMRRNCHVLYACYAKKSSVPIMWACRIE